MPVQKQQRRSAAAVPHPNRHATADIDRRELGSRSEHQVGQRGDRRAAAVGQFPLRAPGHGEFM